MLNKGTIMSIIDVENKDKSKNSSLKNTIFDNDSTKKFKY